MRLELIIYIIYFTFEKMLLKRLQFKDVAII